jgi:hypothetical protein
MLLTTAALLSSGVLAQADQYHGNGNTGFGGASATARSP